MAAVFVSSCAVTPADNVAAFGKATTDLTEKVDKQLAWVIELDKDSTLKSIADSAPCDYVSSSKSADCERLTFKSLQNKTDKYIKRTNKRKSSYYAKANRALNTYSKALTGLAESGSKEQYQVSVGNLHNSINEFNESYKALGGDDEYAVKPEDISKVTSVIGSLGYMYVESRRNKALAEVITSVDPAITKLTGLISKNLESEEVSLLSYNKRRSELQDKVDDYSHTIQNLTIKNKRELSVATRAAMITELFEEYIELQKEDAKTKSLAKSFAAVGKAHAKLAEAAREKDFNTASVSEAISIIKEASKTNDELLELFVDCQEEKDGKKGKLKKKELKDEAGNKHRVYLACDRS